VFSQDVADRFDDALDASTQSVLENFQALTRANMESYIEGFCTALAADFILPEDF